VAKHGLDPNYIVQIAEYLRKQSGESQGPTLGTGYEGTGGGNNAAAAPTSSYAHFPKRPMGGSSGYLLFNSQPKSYDPMLKKLGEASAEAEAAGGVALSAAEEDELRALVGVLSEVSRYHASRIQTAAPELIEQIVSPAGTVRKAKGWAPAGIFAAIDLARLMLCHPNGAERLAKLPSLLSALLGRATEMGAPEPVQLLVARYVANLFMTKPGRMLTKTHAQDLLEALGTIEKSANTNKNVRSAVATVLLNMAATTAAVGGEETVSAAAQRACLEHAVAMTCNASTIGEGDETIYRLLTAIGTLAVSTSGGKAAAGELGLKDFMGRAEVQAAVGASSSKVKDCASELSRCLAEL
jgi:hypothetical protein